MYLLPKRVVDSTPTINLISDASEAPSTDQENSTPPSTPKLSAHNIVSTPSPQRKSSRFSTSPYFQSFGEKPKPIEIASAVRFENAEREKQALERLDALLPTKLKNKLRFDLHKPTSGNLRRHEKRFLAAASEIERLRKRIQLLGGSAGYTEEDDDVELADDASPTAQIELAGAARALQRTLPIDINVHYGLISDRIITANPTSMSRLLSAAKTHIDILQGVDYEDEEYRRMEDEERESNVELWGCLPLEIRERAEEGLPGTRVCRAAKVYIQELEQKLCLGGLATCGS